MAPSHFFLSSLDSTADAAMLWIISWIFLGCSSLLPGILGILGPTGLCCCSTPPQLSVKSTATSAWTVWTISNMYVISMHPILHTEAQAACFHTTSRLQTPSLHPGPTALPNYVITTNHICPMNPSNLCLLPQSSQPIGKQHHLRVAVLNGHSLNNESPILNEFITDNKLDFLCITQTGHKPPDYFSFNQTTPTGFTYIDKPCPEGWGNSVAAIYRKEIKLTIISTPTANLNTLFSNLLVPLHWLLPSSTAPPSLTPPFFLTSLIF